MSPSAVRSSTATDLFDDDLDLSIAGIGVEYPPYANGPEAVEILADRFYPKSNAMAKVLSINRFTGIEKRSAIGTVDHPAVNKPEPPSITELNTLFMEDGVRLSTAACKKAIAEWGGHVDDITHMVSTTCTNSANPGFDHFVARELGLGTTTEKVLLHGIGCSGGMAAMRTAANLALGAKARRKPARVLVLACEISSLLVRSELESIHKDQEVRIGVCLFSDCASACVISNGIGEDVDGSTGPIFDILGWKHDMLEDTAHDLGFDVDPLGWKVILTPRVPSLTSACIGPAFRDLVSSIPALYKNSGSSSALPSAVDFDWALHPGGSTILSGVQNALGLGDDHLKASFEVYVTHGNSSSATVLSVMDKMRQSPGREKVVAAAFGPGICLELLMLRRKDKKSNGHVQANSVKETNGVNGAHGLNGTHEANGSNGVNGTHEANGSNGVVNGSSSPRVTPVDTQSGRTGCEEANGAHANGVHMNGVSNGANGSSATTGNDMAALGVSIEAVQVGSDTLEAEDID